MKHLPKEKIREILEEIKKNGAKVTSISKRYSISRQTIYNWYKKFKPVKEIKYLDFLLQLVIRYPDLNFKQLSKKLNTSSYGFFDTKPSSVYLLLRKLNLSTKRSRYEFIKKQKVKQMAQSCPVIRIGKKNGELSKEARELLLKTAQQNILVSQACKYLNISRTTYYKWKKRQLLGESLVSKIPKIDFYYKQTPEDIERVILNIVRSQPELSLPKIISVLPKKQGRPIIGYYGVQRVLERNNLNNLARRQTYSKSFAQGILPKPKTIVSFNPIYNTLLRLYRMILAPFAVIPKLTTIQSPLFKYFFSTFILTFIFGLYWISILSKSSSFAQSIGLIFASVALTIGMFFFLYSMKYYITVILVLGFSRQSLEDKESIYKTDTQDSKNTLSLLYRIFGKRRLVKGSKKGYAGGLQPDLSKIHLTSHPFVSIHIASYNEKRVIDRLLTAVTSMDYENYEVVLVDDSNDTEAISKVRGWNGHPRLKIIHRETREGYKGGALEIARKHTSAKAEFILVFDSDFIPYPDTITQFLKYFKAVGGWNDATNTYNLTPKTSPIAAIQGYQWHVLNKSENWITRGVRSEYAGSYVVERSGAEIYSGLKQISGSVYMIKRKVLDQIGWGVSITEDFELTLKLYEKGYKVVFTPYIQAPSECVSTVKRLIRQRMRWAEGHSHNIKRMFKPLIATNNMTLSEKFEFLYLSPYYLQSALFVFGTLSWFIAEVIFKVRLPFWTAVWGWSLVLTNMFSLPLMNSVGLFLEESEEKDYLGLLSFTILSYLLAPFQGYAAIKGFLEKEEGPWFRTPKTGHITDIFERGRFYRWLSGIIPWKPALQPIQQRTALPNVAYTYLGLQTANNQFNAFQIRFLWAISLFMQPVLLL
ncbi:glycosyltransferase [Candidatus Gottesmanbacteria bacterium]|nr:glycosyltransferase [Candidatus Gottesmanbacteria bacterium]